jgi:formylglycine-generating enzyme required for sulfatase activity
LLEIVEIPRHAIRDRPLEMVPDKLVWVEFRSIAREPGHLKTGVPFQESGHQGPAVWLAGVPEEGDGQGEFPWQNLLIDHYEGTAPVGRFPAKGYGLFDMASSDWHAPRHADEVVKACCGLPVNPRIISPEQSYNPVPDPADGGEGGLVPLRANYCLRSRPAARQPQMVDTSMSHIGFRCIVRPT